MDGGIRDAQFTGDLGNRLAAGLCQLYCFSLQLGRLGLLRFLHALFPPLRRVYPKISLLYKSGECSR